MPMIPSGAIRGHRMTVTGTGLGYTAPADTAARFTRQVASADLLDKALNLTRSRSDTAALYDGIHAAASSESGQEFLTMLATMIKQGVVGRETLEVRGQRYTSFIENRIAAPDEIAHAPRFDRRA